MRRQNLLRSAVWKLFVRKYSCDGDLSGHEIGFRQLKGFISCASADYHFRYAENQALDKYLQEQLERGRNAGGSRAIHRHTAQHGKLLIRDRIRSIVDADSDFLEIGALAGLQLDYADIPGASSVTGIGYVHGIPCMVAGHDGSVKGGTMYPIGVKKTLRAQEIAHNLRLPCIYLVDSGGAFLPLQSEIFPDKEHGGRTFYMEAIMGSEGIPQISLVCGNCTAGGAYVPTMTDDAVIVRTIGSMFLGGPPLVKAATGEVISAEELGGAMLHCSESGGTDYYAVDESSAFKAIRDIVRTLNISSQDRATDSEKNAPLFSAVELNGIAGSGTTDPIFVHQVLSRILDRSQFSEFRALYGKSLICGFGEICGHLVGVIFATGVPIDSKSAEKSSQLVQMCDDRGISVLVFQKTTHSGWSYSEPGIGLTHRSTAQLMTVLATSDVQKITINVGDCFGADYLALCGRSFGPAFHYSWPNARLAYEKPENGDDASAFRAAARLSTDAVLPPRNTREQRQKRFIGKHMWNGSTTRLYEYFMQLCDMRVLDTRTRKF